MSYLLSEYCNLTVSYRKRGTDFGYHFCVQNNCTNYWACKTKWEFKRWLKNRGLILDKKINIIQIFVLLKANSVRNIVGK